MPRGNDYEGQARDGIWGRGSIAAWRAALLATFPVTADERVEALQEEKGMTRGQSGEVRQREAAPALVDLKPQSCLWLMLPESGGGAKGPMVFH